MRRLSLSLTMLLIGIFAIAAGATESDILLEIPISPLAMTPSDATPDCQEGRWPLETSTAFFAATGEIPCGPCSTGGCNGFFIGTTCGFRQGYTCQNVLGNFCSTTPITHKCQCWSGPLP